MSSVVGCGTNFYGSWEKREDDSYVTTEWITIFYVPVFPLKSYRVIKNNSTITDSGYVISSSAQYNIVEYVSLDVLQVLSVYVAIFVLVAWAAMFISVAAKINIDDSLTLQVMLTAALVLSPTVSFVFAKKANRNPFGWAIGGFLFPLLPIILTTVVPSKTKGQ